MLFAPKTPGTNSARANKTLTIIKIYEPIFVNGVLPEGRFWGKWASPIFPYLFYSCLWPPRPEGLCPNRLEILVWLFK